MSSVVLSGDTSGTVTVQVPAVAGSNTVTIPAVTGNVITSADSATVTPTMLSQPLTQATLQATTSGSTKDFTSIPSWVKRITVTLNAVSASTAVDFLVQLGTSGGIVSSGYASQAWNQGGGTVSSSTSGFLVSAATAAADTPNFSSRCFTSSCRSRTDIFSIASTTALNFAGVSTVFIVSSIIIFINFSVKF